VSDTSPFRKWAPTERQERRHRRGFTGTFDREPCSDADHDELSGEECPECGEWVDEVMRWEPFGFGGGP
jgi:hypothetical protein